MKNNKVYFSNSIQGNRGENFEFGLKIVEYLKFLGFDILSEHVAQLDNKDREKIFFKKTGIDRRRLEEREYCSITYKWEIKWVDKADYIVTIVNGSSYGVGMEIMRALTKEERGFNRTKIVALVREERIKFLSKLVKGASTEYSNFIIKKYTDLNSVKRILRKELN